MKTLKSILLVSLMFTNSLFAQENKVPLDKIAFFCTPCSADCDHLAFEEPGRCTHCNMSLTQRSYKEQLELMNNETSIAFYLQDGVEVLDFAGPMEVFAYAGYDVFTVSKTKDPMTSQGILTFVPDYSIEDAPPADIMAFFGGNSRLPTKDRKVINWVKNRADDTDYFFSVCTGAFILGESGLLDGKTATTFHDALDGLEKNYPKVNVLRSVRFVDNGNIITTAGISAGIDGALHLVAKLKGLEAAKEVAYYMEYDKWTPGEGLILDEQTKSIYAESKTNK